jgi:hypothetical protein
MGLLVGVADNNPCKHWKTFSGGGELLVTQAQKLIAQAAKKETPGSPQTRLKYVAASKLALLSLWKDMLLFESFPSDQLVRRIIQELEALSRASEAHGYPEIEAVSAGVCLQFRKSAVTSGAHALCAGQLWNGLEVLAVLVHESERQLRTSETAE